MTVVEDVSPESARILVVDDTELNVQVLSDILTRKGYQVVTAASGAEGLEVLASEKPDLVLLDVLMPEMNGYEVCRRIRANPDTTTLPVVLVTALDPGEERVKGIEAGADDFLTKPINRAELLARVRSSLRIKRLYDRVQAQAEELEEWNRNLSIRVEQQVNELERLGRLRRFVSPQVADLIISEGEDALLSSHRREIATVFCDMRGFTDFCETVEPEEAMDVLCRYHEAMGEIIQQFEGAIDHRAGDGFMVIFNDPIPCDDAAERAVRMADAMRTLMDRLNTEWRRYGYELGFGVGVSLGYATLGLVGFEGRYDYTANGSAVNLASRLCDKAAGGQILVDRKVLVRIEATAETEFVDNLELKGFRRPVPAYNVVNLK